MNITPRAQLIARADHALAKIAHAEQTGDARALAEARRDGKRIRADLAEQAATDQADAAIKAAFGAPKNAFASSPGAASAWPYSDQERRTLAQSGAAMRNGNYPIKTPEDVTLAFEAWKRTGQPWDGKKHILRRATELGALDRLPDDWRGDTAASSSKFARGNELRKTR